MAASGTEPHSRGLPNFLNVLFRIALEPGSCVPELLERRRPPYTVGILLCLVALIATPFLAQLTKYGFPFVNLSASLGILLALSFAFALFILFEGVLLMIFGLTPSGRELFSLATYSLVPLFSGIFAILIFNYFVDGRLTVVEMMMTGHAALQSKFLQVIPFAFLIIVLNMLVVLFYGVRTLGRLSFSTGAFITALSIVPLYLSLLGGAFLADIFHHGTIETLQHLLLNFSFEVFWPSDK
jgi:hypothetical protein